MGASGAVIMGFFGAVFAAMTMYLQWQVRGIILTLPFCGFLAIGAAAMCTIRLAGNGIFMSEQTKKVLVWSSIGEGIGIFLASNIVTNLQRPDLFLPSIALVVGLHFFPTAYSASFRPFYALGGFLLLAAFIGFLVTGPVGSNISGIAGALSLWGASLIAIHRDRLAKKAAIAFN